MGPGQQGLEIPVLNRYDFTALRQIRGQWKLTRDGKTIQSGNLNLSGSPHQKTPTVVALAMGRDHNRHEYLPELAFVDFEDRSIAEQSIRLLPKGEKVDFRQRLSDLPSGLLQRTDTPTMTSLSCRNYRLDIDKVRGCVTIHSIRSQQRLLTGPLFRVGRTPAMAEYRNYPRYNIKFWEPPLLTDAKLLDCRVDASINDRVQPADLSGFR